MIHALANKRFAGGYTPLVSVAHGPTAAGDTTAGLTQNAWVAWVDETGAMRLGKLGSANPIETSPAPLASANFAAASKIALAFEQNARRILAWGLAGQVFVSRIGATLLEERLNFAGHDPVLVNDGILLESDSFDTATDVLLFYLNASRTQVMYRLQAENFATEHAYATLPTAHSLDTWGQVGLSLVLYCNTATEARSVISGPYRAAVGDTVALAGTLAGELSGSEALENGFAAAGFTATSLQALLSFPIEKRSRFEAARLTNELSGLYKLTVKLTPTNTDAATLGSTLSGLYVLVIKNTTPVAEATNLGTTILANLT